MAFTEENKEIERSIREVGSVKWQPDPRTARHMTAQLILLKFQEPTSIVDRLDPSKQAISKTMLQRSDDVSNTVSRVLHIRRCQ